MPKVSDAGATHSGHHYDQATGLGRRVGEEEPEELAPEAEAPSEPEDEPDDDEEGDEPSAGTSSLISGDRPEKSGDSTGTDRQSPAPTTESLSSKGPAAKPRRSSAATTAGSGRATGSDRPSPQASSEGLVAQSVATATPSGYSEQDPSAGGFLVPGV